MAATGAAAGTGSYPTVSGKFVAESARHQEASEPISCAELGRHCAAVGSIACALANPLKEQHYYLAARAAIDFGPNIHGNGAGALWKDCTLACRSA